MSIILVTDRHLRDPEGSTDAAHHTARIGAYLDQAAEAFPDAVCCVLAGDLADAGEVAAYGWLKRKLDTLPLPSIPMLGNHDDRDAFHRVFHPGDSSGGFIQSTQEFGGFRLVFLDTHEPGTDSGFLCNARLDWLDRRLAEGGDVCLFMHHPPCDIGDPILDPLKLSNSDDLATLLQRHGNVRQVFFGHVHRTMILTWNGIPCASLGSLGAEAGTRLPGHGPVLGLLTPDHEGLALTVRPLP